MLLCTIARNIRQLVADWVAKESVDASYVTQHNPHQRNNPSVKILFSSIILRMNSNLTGNIVFVM